MGGEMDTFLETADVAKRAGITPGLVRREAAEGRLEATAVTERGGRLFSTETVRRYLEERRSRRAARKRRSR
jgi:DNA-binding transcriptional MerR regulator